ncbi:MAG: hypothetical protein JWL84_3916 [Rhodospirillales bacterium]|nr:hypothetical protein [Rhodospirillales bacterium]
MRRVSETAMFPCRQHTRLGLAAIEWKIYPDFYRAKTAQCRFPTEAFRFLHKSGKQRDLSGLNCCRWRGHWACGIAVSARAKWCS